MRIPIGRMWRGRALVEQQHISEGMVEIRAGLAVYQETGAALAQPIMLAFLAEAASRGQLFGEGLTALTEALAQTQRTGERFYEAELYRLRGELLLAQAGKNLP